MVSPGVDELRWLKPVRPGDRLHLRVQVVNTRLSRSDPGRGIVRDGGPGDGGAVERGGAAAAPVAPPASG